MTTGFLFGSVVTTGPCVAVSLSTRLRVSPGPGVKVSAGLVWTWRILITWLCFHFSFTRDSIAYTFCPSSSSITRSHQLWTLQDKRVLDIFCCVCHWSHVFSSVAMVTCVISHVSVAIFPSRLCPRWVVSLLCCWQCTSFTCEPKGGLHRLQAYSSCKWVDEYLR